MRMKEMLKRPEICVPIVAPFRDAILREAKEAAAAPVGMAEWRVDYFAGYEKEILGVIEELKKILGEKKLIVTLRTEYEGGEPNGSRFSYFPLIKEIRVQGVADFVDVEIMRDEKTLAALISETSDSPVRVIGSYHDFEKTPDADFIENMLVRARKLGCDTGKFACMPQGKEDVDTLLNATVAVKKQIPEFPLITMSMGAEGVVSRLYGGLYGSEVSFGCMQQVSAPGQISYERMNEVFDRIYSGRKHIVLIGFMGVGKSTVSAVLSELTGWQEIDTDALIEEREGRAIPEIFAESGEEYFRTKETELIDTLSELPPSIISCGGGMALRELNARKLKAIGQVVWLTAEPENIYRRVKNTTNRPLLNGNMNVEHIRGLMEKREPFYERASDVAVATDDRDIASVAKEILEKSDQIL